MSWFSSYAYLYRHMLAWAHLPEQAYQHLPFVGRISSIPFQASPGLRQMFFIDTFNLTNHFGAWSTLTL
eukprot:759945-Hanusia_phi.AAC.3